MVGREADTLGSKALPHDPADSECSPATSGGFVFDTADGTRVAVMLIYAQATGRHKKT
jgi:hypothetical protein